MRFQDDTPAPSDPIDWPAVKAEILAKLDVAAECEALGVEFTRPSADGKDWRRCRAVGRPDDNPSAGVNLQTGLYHDFGESGRTLSFFDLALELGQFGRWIDCIRHYAAKAGIVIGPVPTHGRGRIREATYLYRDAAGHLKYAVFRYRLPNGRKEFTQHPPDGKGGWKYGPGCMDGVEPLPYRLPELLASAMASDPVWICEGEKDCDRLAALGLAATTNHQGCASTDRTWPKFIHHFAGRDCYVIPDNDPGGFKHAIKVCAYLKPVARLVKLIELPGLPAKGDISNWLDLGHDVEELGRLAAEKPAWESTATEEVPKRRPAHLGDLRRLNTGTFWIWEGWLPSARVSGLAAYEGTGKTRFTLDLARRVWHGLPWPDGQAPTFPAGTPTLWICADGNQDDLLMAVAAMGLPDDAIFLNTVPEDPYGGTDLDDSDILDDLDEFIPIVRPAFIVIDSLTNATRHDLCRQNEVKVFTSPLKELAQKHQVTFFLQVHLSKDGQALGRRIRGMTRTLLHLTCPDPENDPDRRRLWVEKSFDRKPPALGVAMTAAGNEYDCHPPSGRDPGPAPTERDRAKQFIRDALGVCDGRKVMELCQEFQADGGAERTFWRARDELVNAGEITCDGKPKVLRRVNPDGTNGEANGIDWSKY